MMVSVAPTPAIVFGATGGGCGEAELGPEEALRIASGTSSLGVLTNLPVSGVPKTPPTFFDFSHTVGQVKAGIQTVVIEWLDGQVSRTPAVDGAFMAVRTGQTAPVAIQGLSSTGEVLLTRSLCDPVPDVCVPPVPPLTGE